MAETKVKKSFMDKLTGFFYKSGHYLVMIIAYVAVAFLAVVSGIIAGKGAFDFSNPAIKGWAIAFIVAVILLGLALIFSFVKSLRKVSNYFFAAIGFIACAIIGIVAGYIFFKFQGGSFSGAPYPVSDYSISAAVSGGLFTTACILVGLVVIGGICYSISMADNRRKEKALKRAQNN